MSQDFYSSLGTTVSLMMHAPYHSSWLLMDVEREVFPPLIKNQFRIYQDTENNPVGFVSWAAITEEMKNNLVHMSKLMSWEDWDNGDLLIFYDFIAPFGHTRKILKDLRSQEWPYDIAFSLRRDMDGGIAKVNYWWHDKDKHDSDLQSRRERLGLKM